MTNLSGVSGMQPLVITFGGNAPSLAFGSTRTMVRVSKVVPVVVSAASPKPVSYYAGAPAVACSYSGLVAPQTTPTTPARGRSAYAKGDPAGSYSTSCYGASDSAYSFTYIQGKQVVNLGKPRLKLASLRSPATHGKKLSVSAALTYGPVGPVSARWISLTLGTGRNATTCRAITNKHGVASCSLKVSASKGKATLAGAFAGDPKGRTYDYASARSSMIVTIK